MGRRQGGPSRTGSRRSISGSIRDCNAAAGPFSPQPCGLRAFWPPALSLIGKRPPRVFSLFASRIQPKFAAAWCTNVSETGMSSVSTTMSVELTMISTVPSGTEPLSIANPGTSCLATIVLSLRDKSRSSIETPHKYLSAYGRVRRDALFTDAYRDPDIRSSSKGQVIG